MVVGGGESPLSLSRSGSMTGKDAADVGTVDGLTGGATVMSMSDSLGNLTSIGGVQICQVEVTKLNLGMR